MTTKRLGKGFAEILESTTPLSPNVVALRVDQIKPNRFQPREAFDQPELEELKASIKQHGVIQPVIVRPIAHGSYELVAGERRLRASQLLGIKEVPAIIKSVNDQEALELSLIENVQRTNLNPLEEAKGYTRLIDEFGYTQDQLAQTLGKDRSSIANSLRLLKLPEDIQQGLAKGKISVGHAKALLGLEIKAQQLDAFRKTVTQGWSVRQLEEYVVHARPLTERRHRSLSPELKAIEDELRRLLGTKVSLKIRTRGGRILIDYFSSEDLQRILHTLGIRPGADGA